MRLVAGFAVLLLPGQYAHSPQNRGQAKHERHVGDVVDQRVRHHVRAGTAGASEDEGKDEVAHAGAIRHHERAEHRAFKAVGAQNFQPPDHQERRDDEQRQEQPRRVRSFGFNPMDERVQHAPRSLMKAISGRDIEVWERHGFYGLTRRKAAWRPRRYTRMKHKWNEAQTVVFPRPARRGERQGDGI